MNSPLNSSWPRLALFCLGALLAFSVACNRGPSQLGAATGQPTAKRYSLKGRVISVDKNAATANIDNEPIAGFMDAMIMPYTIKPPSTLDQLQPGDSITADVVVEPDRYWLENVKVTGHSKAPAGTPTATVHIPNPGDLVPDFKLINQNGRTVSVSRCISIVARPCCSRSSIRAARSPTSARASAMSSPRSTARSVLIRHATAERTCSASASTPPTTRPRFCAHTASPAPEGKIPRSLRIGSSLRFRQTSYLNLPIILL
jgi:Cu/Ag efflux protein CusF